MTKLHMQDCHTSGREKMAKISGSPKNFESQSDKAERFCRGGYADGGAVTPNSDDMDRAKRNLTSDLDLNSRTNGALARNYGNRAMDIADAVRKR